MIASLLEQRRVVKVASLLGADSKCRPHEYYRCVSSIRHEYLRGYILRSRVLMALGVGCDVGGGST